MVSRRHSKTPFLAAAAALALAADASAQQFQNQVGIIPGPARWTEGVEASDVDQDGDLDLFFADGDGFSSAGAKRQNVLVINQLIETSSLSFTDESVARLGAHSSNGKGVTTGDADGDGWVDALFTNAFNTDPAFLYINQGAGNPGFFDFEGAARGFTTNVAAGSSMFADVDDDGDLDVVMNNNYLGSGSGKPRLYINDGAGNFTLTPSGFTAAVNKGGHMDVAMVDMDNDWKVDFWGTNRSSNGGVPHFLMTNDGNGVFAEQSPVVPNTSGNCYESEVGDLDGDNDMDMFFVSLSGFAEGAMENNLDTLGVLGFTKGSNLGGDDDNEIALYDYDNDGDYDAFVGRLLGREKLWQNNGGLSFSNNNAAIQAISDSTADITFADVDNDGDYDLITAQGESASAQWANKIYLNSGPADDQAPGVNDIKSPANGPKAGPTVVHAKVSDQVQDDGVDFVTGTARYVVLAAPASVNVSITAGAFSPSNVNISAGTSVVFTNTSGSSQSVTSTTAPYSYDVTIPNGQSYEHFFVAAGAYNFTSTPGGFNGSATVTGATTSVAGLKAGVQQHRFQMNDTLGGTGARLVYELEFTDWVGNTTVTDNGVVELVDCNLSTYCTAKPSSLASCTPTISGSGTPSASAGSGFTVSASPLPGGPNPGLFIYTTNGAATSPISNSFGFLCIQAGPGLFRIGTSLSAGGTTGVCNGAYSIDFNDHFATQTQDAALVPGAQVDIQCWYRDPPNPGFANLTNAGVFYMCP